MRIMKITGTSTKAKTGRERPSENSARSDEFEAGEEIADFEGGGFRGVGAMRTVHLDTAAEVVANRAGHGFLRIRGAHGFAPFGDGAIGFKDHGEDFAGTHEVGEFAEEGALAMDGVKAAGLFFGQAHGFDRNEFEAGFVDARKNLTLKIAANCIRLDNRERTFHSHEIFLRNLQKDRAAARPLQN